MHLLPQKQSEKEQNAHVQALKNKHSQQKVEKETRNASKQKKKQIIFRKISTFEFLRKKDASKLFEFLDQSK